jgi:hypothetical protein
MNLEFNIIKHLRDHKQIDFFGDSCIIDSMVKQIEIVQVGSFWEVHVNGAVYMDQLMATEVNIWVKRAKGEAQ